MLILMILISIAMENCTILKQACPFTSKGYKAYEEIKFVVRQKIYRLLEEKYDLVKQVIPINSTTDEGQGFIYTSKDLKKFKSVILTVHGSGKVRAGQWSRELIVTESLKSGSQVDYIKKSQELGLGVILLNTNQDKDSIRGKPIFCNKTPLDHFFYTWKYFLLKSGIKNMAVVAHSDGGDVVMRAAMSISNFTQ